MKLRTGWVRALTVALAALLITASVPDAAVAQQEGDAPVFIDENGQRIPLTLDESNAPARDAFRPQVAGLSVVIDRLNTAWQLGEPAVRADADLNRLERQGDQVKVTVIMRDAAAAGLAQDAIVAAGGRVTAFYGRWIDAFVPIPALDVLAQLPDLLLIDTPIALFPLDLGGGAAIDASALALAGSITSEGVAASNAGAWHTAGYTGGGVEVAILDRFRGYTDAQAVGELPPSPQLKTFGTLLLDSNHGTAVAEIIHDVAPGANLTLASPTTAVEMANTIDTLSQQGYDVIASSIGFFNAEPGDGTGVVSDAITLARSRGTLYVQAAGNQATYNYQGQQINADGDQFLDFDTSGTELLIFGNMAVGSPLRYFLRWNNWPAGQLDYGLVVYRWNGSSWVAVAGADVVQNGNRPPTEALIYTTTTAGFHGLAVLINNGSSNAVIDIMGNNTYDFPAAINRRDRSLIDPATSRGTMGVSAVDVTIPYDQMIYSSEGPSLGAGGSLGAGNNQPRISAYTNVSTWSRLSNPDPGALPSLFIGSSAAAPHVAGAAALVKEANPTFDADDIAAFLEARAQDKGIAGYDTVYGAGRLFLGDPPSILTPTPSETPPTPIPPTGTPVLIAPNGVTDQSPSIDFLWQVVPNAEWYYLYIVGEESVVHQTWYYSLVCIIDTCLANPDVEWTTGAYEWWVQAYGPGGFSSWSSPMTFNAPTGTPVAGTPAGLTDLTSIVFTWDDITGVPYYQLFVTDPTGATLIDEWVEGAAACAGGVCAVTPTEVFEGVGGYRWWLRGWHPVSGLGAWSGEQVFFGQIPQVITQEPDGATGAPTDFVWEAIPGVTWYELYIQRSGGDFVSAEWVEADAVCVLTTCTASIPGLSADSYLYWVRGWEAVSGLGAWSAPKAFVVIP